VRGNLEQLSARTADAIVLGSEILMRWFHNKESDVMLEINKLICLLFFKLLNEIWLKHHVILNLANERTGRIIQIRVSKIKHFFSSSPVQITPFPEYPELHAHVKRPGMFVQVAVPTAQLLDPVVHSSMS